MEAQELLVQTIKGYHEMLPNVVYLVLLHESYLHHNMPNMSAHM